MSDINEKWVCIFGLPGWKCITNTEGEKREGEIAGLAISMGLSNIPPKKNHASYSNTVILPYVIHDGQSSQADSTIL